MTCSLVCSDQIWRAQAARVKADLFPLRFGANGRLLVVSRPQRRVDLSTGSWRLPEMDVYKTVSREPSPLLSHVRATFDLGLSESVPTGRPGRAEVRQPAQRQLGHGREEVSVGLENRRQPARSTKAKKRAAGLPGSTTNTQPQTLR